MKQYNSMENVIKLLEAYKKFLDHGFPPNLEYFGKWLSESLHHERPKDQKVNQLAPESKSAMLAYSLGILMSFSELWTKLAFKDLPLVNISDFGILKYIEITRQPTKKDVAENSIMEKSTCFEAIKRLERNNLLEEFADPNDKRARRVNLTTEGEKIIDRATVQTQKLSGLLIGDLNEKEVSLMLDVITKLNKFHKKLYKEGQKDKIIATYEF